MYYFFCFIDSLCEYMQSIMAGLAGTPHLVAATILALTRLVYEFKGKTIKINEHYFFSIQTVCQKFISYYLICNMNIV